MATRLPTKPADSGTEAVTDLGTDTGTQVAPVDPVSPARDPAHPIGTPPGGGSWTWDIQKQEWARVPDA